MRKIVLYGMGKNGKNLYDRLVDNEVDDIVYAICDKNAEQIKEYRGRKVCTYEELKDSGEELLFIITPNNSGEIEKMLERDGQKYMERTWEEKVFAKVPAGHFYSPIPNIEELAKEEDRIFREISVEELEASGIDLNKEGQEEMMRNLSVYLQDEFPEKKEEGSRFYHDNASINHTDSLTLHAMLRYLKPKNVIEIGCGRSSAMMLDTNEKWLDNQMHISFIEPYPELLKSVMKEDDQIKQDITVYPKRVQDMPLEKFEELQEGDVLFIDSTHVSKIGSDVHFEMFEIFPRLKPGVMIHLHDVCYGFSYPRHWLFESMFHWNETYLLRAFLSNNRNYEIVFWPDSLPHFSKEWEKYCHTGNKWGGGSIWLRKIR